MNHLKTSTTRPQLANGRCSAHSAAEAVTAQSEVRAQTASIATSELPPRSQVVGGWSFAVPASDFWN